MRLAGEADLSAEALENVAGNAQSRTRMLPGGMIFQRRFGLRKGLKHMFAKLLGFPGPWSVTLPRAHLSSFPDVIRTLPSGGE
jgi:hypothetical protein